MARIIALVLLALALSGCASIFVKNAQEEEEETTYCSSLHEIREVRSAWRDEDGSISICVSATPASNYQPGESMSYNFRRIDPDADYLLKIPAPLLASEQREPDGQYGTLPVFNVMAVSDAGSCAVPPDDRKKIEIVKLPPRKRDWNDMSQKENDPELENSIRQGSGPAIFERAWSHRATQGYQYEYGNQYIYYRHDLNIFAGDRFAALDASGEGPPGRSGVYWGTLKTAAVLWDIVTFPIQIFVAVPVLYNLLPNEMPACVEREP
jgi:hypothetical protein